VDDTRTLEGILESIVDVSQGMTVIFPVHPRTRQGLADSKLNLSGLKLLEPLPYLEFLALQRRATVVITDSGGIQEETTYLGVPCLTLRENTERPITVSLGTNVIVGQDRKKLSSELTRIVEGKAKKGTIPPLWDGKTGERIADILFQRLSGNVQSNAGIPHGRIM
jgi:UDP-N-acetylglucosamine 2-epimerase (non-hydrolysing)